MAGGDAPISSKKRGQPGEGSVESSAKKRRLNATQTRALPNATGSGGVIASAISGMVSIGRRFVSGTAAGTKPSESPTSIDTSYEIPDSEDERRKKATTPLKSRPSSRKSSQSATKTVDPASIYDVPDSGDELNIAPTATRKKATPTGRRSLSAKPATQSPARRAGGRAPQHDANDLENSSEDDINGAETPSGSKRGSRRKNIQGSAYKVEPIRLGRQRDNEGDEHTTARSSGRRKRAPSPRTARDGTPVLRGILTPSKKAGKQTPKTVAFQNGTETKAAELHFDDLPTDPVKKPKGSRSSSALAPARGKGKVQTEEQHESTQDKAEDENEAGQGEEDDSEDEDEDDEVCVICSKPDSKPPNEIIFCDHCDRAFHQKCYNVPVIPEGDWLCRDCSQEENATDALRTAVVAAASEVPDIPQLDRHVQSLQRVLLERCAGRRPIQLRGQEEAYDKAYQLVEQTVMAGEGNSMMVIGARGSGKTTMVESIISELSRTSKDQFHVVRLSGFIHTDDKLALKDIWRQLGREMEVQDDLVSKTNNYADTLASLLALLSHPSEITGTQEGITSKSVVFIMDEFDLFATHPRQTLLYNLFDIAQARKAPIAVLGLTTRIDVVESLEKRVKSRFSHRYVYLTPPKSLPAFWDICKQGLTVNDADMKAEGIDQTLEGHDKFWLYWNAKVEGLYENSAFKDNLEYHYFTTKSVPAFLTSCILPLASLQPAAMDLQFPPPLPGTALEPPDAKTHLLASLSDLDLSLLIAAARLDIVAHTDTVNFAMAYDEYAALVGRQRVQSATAGMLAVGGGARVWGRGVAGVAWERLASVGMLIPAAGMGRGGASQGGSESRMWKVDVALEEIPSAVKLNAVLARWCREL